jgi:hypothetical protein
VFPSRQWSWHENILGSADVPEMIVINARPTLITALVAVILSATDAHPCSLAKPVSSLEMVKQSDVIVRATAVEYAMAPRNPNIWTTGEPDSMVRFKVLEVIRGRMSSELVLPGYLVNRDDFNDEAPPYNFVRPNGRSGSCFANSYRSGAQFLLILKKEKSVGYTVNWYALGPVNEQLHSTNDPWLLWVREQVRKQAALSGK